MPSVGSILADLFGQVGLSSSQYDVSQATDVVDGFVITDRQEMRSSIEQLLAAFQTILAEVDGKIVAIKRGAAPVLTVANGDLGCRIVGGGEVEPVAHVEVSRLSELELPFRIDYTFFTRARLYQQSMQSAIRHSKISLQDAVTIQAPLVLLDTQGRQIAEEQLYQQWIEREQFIFSLPWSYLQLAPGDVINLPVLNQLLRTRIIQVDIGLFGPLNYTAVLDDPTILTQTIPGAPTLASGQLAADAGTTTMVVWTGPALVDTDATTVGLYVAAGPATAGSWNGCTVYWSRDGGTTYQELVTLTDPAVWGTAVGALAGNPTTGTGAWDDANTVTVTIPTGTPPLPTTDSDVYNGANGALLGDEIIQFGNITSLGGNQYLLSHLLRARRGTDWHWTEHQPGERFVILDTGQVARVNLTLDLMGRQLFLKAVTAGQSIASTPAVSLYVTGDEFRPYSPVQLTKSRDGSFNLTLSWIRRARTNYELQDNQDEPLGETSENYNITILGLAPVTITAVVLGSSTTFTAAAHGFIVNDKVFLAGLIGPVYLNGIVATVTAATTNTFTIANPSLGMAAYVSGGTAAKVIRTLTAVTPTVVYTAANQTTDGFTPSSSTYSIAIMQVGTYGPGFPLTAQGV